MYRKVFRLRTQVENGNIDVDKVKTLLWSIFEQAEATGNKDACILTGLADKWLDMHNWQDGKKDKASLSDIVKDIREGTLLDDLELLAWALAAKDIEKIERLITNQHGFNYDKIEEYRDSGVITEHFTPKGNLAVWIKHEKTTPNGTKMRCEFMAYLKNGRVKIGICDPYASLDVMLENIDMKIASQQ